MKKIAIFGAGGFGREVHSLIQQLNLHKQQYDFIGYFDDGIDKGTTLNDFPVLGGLSDLNKWNENLLLVIAIGNPIVKRKIIDNITNINISYPTIIHPNVFIGDMKFNSIGKGCIICAGVIITVNINIGNFVILNLSCTVGHDTNIGDYCSFMPTVNISGEVNIGKDVYIGTGAKIINQLAIGDGAIVGAGAVVAKSLPSNCTAVGVPARVIKSNN
ncbi:MAG: acetyltransferase [Bacteroidales bacterium]|jgi:sugar O-acyltransferase (sialic acid O-acetyltransferase NeuD family)